MPRRPPEVNKAALDAALKYNPDVTAALEKAGKAIARDAADAAPKDDGDGARSIHHELGHDQRGPYVRVSWDKRHFYMMFHEFGTSHENARPFLRPAAAKRRTL